MLCSPQDAVITLQLVLPPGVFPLTRSLSLNVKLLEFQLTKSGRALMKSALCNMSCFEEALISHSLSILYLFSCALYTPPPPCLCFFVHHIKMSTPRLVYHCCSICITLFEVGMHAVVVLKLSLNYSFSISVSYQNIEQPWLKGKST